MKKKQGKIETEAYMPIYDPVSFRRHIILTSIDIIKMLEKYENLQKLRNDKRKLLQDIKSRISELKGNSNLFLESLPEVREREVERKAIKIERKVEGIKPYPSYKNLDKELNDLREKLSRLNI